MEKLLLLTGTETETDARQSELGQEHEEENDHVLDTRGQGLYYTSFPCRISAEPASAVLHTARVQEQRVDEMHVSNAYRRTKRILCNVM